MNYKWSIYFFYSVAQQPNSAATYTTQTNIRDIHPCLQRDSNPQPQHMLMLVLVVFLIILRPHDDGL
jgi:hypothetical protein